MHVHTLCVGALFVEVLKLPYADTAPFIMSKAPHDEGSLNMLDWLDDTLLAVLLSHTSSAAATGRICLIPAGRHSPCGVLT